MSENPPTAPEQPEASLAGIWTNNGRPLQFRLVDGKWVQNEGGEQGYGAGYIFNSDGTYVYMISLSDIHRQQIGTGIYRGVYSTDGDKLTLSIRNYDFVSKNRDSDTTSEKTGEEIYFYSFGVKYESLGEGLILQPEDTSVSDSFFFPLK